MNSGEIRRIFYKYFIDKGHQKVLSSSLVPARDPSLLFTNAGMNQFKGVFLQEERRDYKRAVTIQKCMRVSGKHNDFDEVGKTDFHHTFFEMLGNFSFGDYFKEQAVEYSWELLTNHFHLPPERLRVTVFREDDEAQRIWEERIGVPAHKIHRLDEKDNFWQMGETGPCGPCSEIHYDRGEAFGPGEFVDGNRRYVEVWNLVFMQFFRDSSGALNPLPAPSIDTGMGMERLAAILQNVRGNYQTDLFLPLIRFTAGLAGIDPEDDGHRVDFNVIADHARALTFLISDGVVPSNEGRGYVLRRILRRAVRHGRSLKLNGHFLGDVCGETIRIMSSWYPELPRLEPFIRRMIEAEEERFNRTLLNGLKIFDDLLARTAEAGKSMIPGKEIFKLSDTYGFPVDFARDLATEKNLAIDLEEFQREMEEQKERSRKSLREKRKETAALAGIDSFHSTFLGYDHDELDAIVLGLYRGNTPVDELNTGEKGLLVTDRTPCYPEGGGQVGDTGSGKSESALFSILDTKRGGADAVIHEVVIEKGPLGKGDQVRLEIDRERRRNTAVHHSATHLLHASLREVLGDHCKQSGSYVAPDKLRFDFTHFQPMSAEEKDAVEDLINRKIRENLAIGHRTLPYEEAIQAGAMAIFEEKYSDRVRMVEMEGYSRELCGGTHLEHTGEIGLFRIQSESSSSSGIRRIEALAGEPAFVQARQQSRLIHKILGRFHQTEGSILDFLETLEEKSKSKEREIKREPKAADVESLIAENRIESPFPAVVAAVEGIDPKSIGTMADEIKKRIEGVAVLFTTREDRTHLVVSVAANLTNKIEAHIIIKKMAAMINGKGGGRADFAQAGGSRIASAAEFRVKIGELLTAAS